MNSVTSQDTNNFINPNDKNKRQRDLLDSMYEFDNPFLDEPQNQQLKDDYDRRRTTNQNKNSLLVIDDSMSIQQKRDKNGRPLSGLNDQQEKLVYKFDSKRQGLDNNSQEQVLTPDQIPIHTTSNNINSSISNQGGLDAGLRFQQNFINGAINYQNNIDINYQTAQYQEIVDREDQMSKLKVEKKKQKRKYIIYGLIVLVVVIVILAIVLVASLKGSSNDQPFVYNPIANPYKLIQSNQSSYGTQKYVLKADRSRNNFQVRVSETENNKLFDEIMIQTQSLQYGQYRVMIGSNQDIEPYNITEYQQFGEGFYSPEYLQNFQKGISNDKQNYIIQVVETEKNLSQVHDDQKYNQVYWKLYDKTRNYDLITTQDQQITSMNKFSQQGLKLNSTKFIGLRESNGGELFLKPGNYSMDPLAEKNLKQPGDTTFVQQSFIPFLVAILNNGLYVGIYIRSNYALQFELIINSTTNQSVLNIMNNGGQMDLNFFVEENLNHLIQKFQQVVGKPKMLPFWSQGLFLRGLLINDADKALQIIDNYQSIGFPLQGISFTKDSLSKGQNFGFQDTITQIRRQYPNIQMILPFTHFKVDGFEQSKYLSFLQFDAQNLTVNYNLNSSFYQGICLDPFNPNITFYLQDILNQNLYDPQTQGLWLDNDNPFLSGIISNSNNFEDQQYSSFPYQPSGTIIAIEKVIPYSAKSILNQVIINSNQTNQRISRYYDLQTIYGSVFAKKMVESSKLISQKQQFLISDSLSIGMGQYGIAYNLNRFSEYSYKDYRSKIINMINFGMAGLPNVINQQCLSKDVETTLCLNYQKLNILSPLIIFNDINSMTLDPTQAFDQATLNSLKSIQIQRFKFLSYQRTELYKIQKQGGSLINALGFDYPQIKNISDISTLLFGQQILVNIPTEQNQTNSTFEYPDYKLIDLNTMEVHRSYIGQSVLVNVTYQNDQMNFYQRGISSIIAFQETKGRSIQKVEDLRNVPMTISVSLEGFLQGGYAQGQIYVEQGEEQNLKTEFYEIKALDYIISIKQQNSGAAENIAATQIEKIYITFLDKAITTACAIMNDYDTVQQLYVVSYNSSRQQALIQPNDPNNPNDKSILKINQVAFILYGQSDLKCNRSLFDLQFDSLLKDDQYSLQIKVTQKMSALYGGWTFPIYFNLTLLSDNSLYFRIDSTSIFDGNDKFNSIYDRQFSDFSNQQKSFAIRDIVTYNQNPFYIQIVNPNNKNQVLFTTKDKLNFFHIDFNIFNFEQPNSNPDRFYGLGERKGDFFLNDKYTYALFSNNNNIPSSQQAYGRVVEYGKNGHFPVFYSQIKSSSNVNAFLVYTSQGTEFTLNKQSDKQSPRMTLLQHNAKTEFTFIFNAQPQRASQLIKQHIILGSLVDSNSLKINSKILPPLEFMYGNYQLFKNQDSLQDFVSLYRNKTKWPLEGISFDMESLNGYQSLTFNQTKFKKLNDDLYFMQTQGLRVFQIQKTGFATTSKNKYTDYIIKNNLTISPPFPDYSEGIPQYGFDEEFQIVYVDYSLSASQKLILQMYNDYMGQFNLDLSQFGVQLKRNEISKLYCSESSLCFKDKFYSENVNWVGKPGNNQMTVNSLGWAFRDIGREDQYHNLNGLMEQMQFANTFGAQTISTLSDSNALGSGNLGFVGRVQDFYNFNQQDLTSAIYSIQTMSTIGMPLIGAQFDLNQNDISSQQTQSLLSQQIMLNSFSPLSFQNIDLGQNFSYINFDHAKLQRLKYFLLKYVRTQHYIYLNEGLPISKPMFFAYPDDQETYNVLGQQFMIGDNLLIRIQDLTQQTQNVYLPKGLWCSIAYLSSKTNCITSFGQYQQIQNDSLAVFQRQGSISVFQDTISRNISNTKDLQENYQIDLHILQDPSFKTTQVQATGRLLVHGYDPIYQGFCDLQLNFSADTLSLYELQIPQTAQGFSKNSKQNLQQSQPNQLQCNYKGFYLGKVYIYNSKSLGYTKATVNDRYWMTLQSTQADPNLIVFLSPMSNMHIADIQTIKFTV